VTFTFTILLLMCAMTQSVLPMIFYCVLAKTHGHPDLMYCHDQRVQRLGETLKNASYHVSRYLIFASETDSYRLIVLMYTILNLYPHHVAIAQTLQCVLREIVHSG